MQNSAYFRTILSTQSKVLDVLATQWAGYIGPQCWLYTTHWAVVQMPLLQSWTLYKSADCRWMSITILCVSFTNSATVGSLEQVQLCNPRIDQSADNITGLKCAKRCLILKYSISRIPDINLKYTCYINQDADQRNVQNDSLLCCRIYKS